MAKDASHVWSISRRRFADVVGLDPEAEWLVGGSARQSTALGQFLSRSLTELYEFQTYPLRDIPRLDDQVPFSFVISPEPGGENGKELLEVLDKIALSTGDDEKFDAVKEAGVTARARFFAMSAADRTALLNNGKAGAICNAAFFEAAVAHEDFPGMSKVWRLSSAIRQKAVFEADANKWRTPDWVEPALAKALKKSPKTGGKPVVVGVIDDSFAIGHPRFQFSNGTSRVFSYWDQDADFNTVVSSVAFGRELLSFNPHDFDAAWPDIEGLNDLLKQAGDEDRPPSEFYGMPGLSAFFPPRPSEALRLASHGTHVLDLVAGAPQQEIRGFPPEQVADAAPPLVLVKLPRTSVQQTSGAFLEFFLLEGVRHIVQRARMLSKNAKVVIVSSYGFYGGPHDGASQIERELDNIVAQGGGDIEIVLPSGNGRLARSHTRRDFNTRDIQSIEWQLPPDDRTPSVMEIWSEVYPPGAGEMLELSIVTPDGNDSAAVGVSLTDTDTTQQIQLVQNGVVVVQAVCVHPVQHAGRRQFLVWMQPTALDGPDTVPTPASSGTWTIRLRALDLVQTRPASVWIRRDDSLVGFASGGRQSGLARDHVIWKNNPNLAQIDREIIGDEGTVQRSCTISKIATGSRAVIVGGFDAGAGDRFPAPSSAGGPTAPRPDPALPDRVGPDALGPSQIFGDIGIAAAGFFGGGKVRFRGTSVAAPLVATEIVQSIGTGGFPGGRDYVQAQAAISEATLPARSAPSAALGGSGRYMTERMRNRAMPFENSDP